MSTVPSNLDTRAFAMLVHAAERGEPCPSNPQIAEAFGFSSISSGHRVVERLRKAGLILVESGQCSRVVTIVATGKRTAGEAGKAHWRMFRPSKPKAPRKPYVRRLEPIGAPLSALPQPVRRDPCPRCGVRGDVGCSHQAPNMGFSPTSTLRGIVAEARSGA